LLGNGRPPGRAKKSEKFTDWRKKLRSSGDRHDRVARLPAGDAASVNVATVDQAQAIAYAQQLAA
jgi:hypothetical protein